MTADLSWQPALLDVELGVRRRDLRAGAWVEHEPGWYAGADALFTDLLHRTPWGPQRIVRMYDRLVPEPRLTHRWTRADAPGELATMADVLSARFGVEFSQVGANLYRDGDDAVAWHGDRLGDGRADEGGPGRDGHARELPDAGPAQVEQLQTGLVQALLAQKAAEIGAVAVREAYHAITGEPVTRETVTDFVSLDAASAPGSEYVDRSSC